MQFNKRTQRAITRIRKDNPTSTVNGALSAIVDVYLQVIYTLEEGGEVILKDAEGNARNLYVGHNVKQERKYD